MRFAGFGATPDIVGGRVWLTWDYALDALETPGDAPDILVRRKRRDFDFPALVPGDPYLVYDSATFPPAPVPGVLQVIDLPREEGIEGELRIVAEAISVAAVAAGQAIEVQRRQRSVFYGRDGAPVRLRDALLDAGGLQPLTAYYYELDDGTAPGPEEIGRYRRVVTAGGTYGLNRRLYAMLPETYRAHDGRALPPAAAFAGVPEASPVGGQLRRFLDVFGMGLDALRSSAETLRDLRDPQEVEARFLGRLSRTIGWEPSNTAEIPQQRNELATATRLFDVVGTVPALRALVTHQTGWRAQVAEFAQHIARANLPARRNLHVRAEQAGGGWRGADDAAAVFAFPPGGAIGVGALPATLTSANVEPFALRPGMELTITVDGGTPARVRFGPDDFADLAAATAVEVAAVVAAAFDNLAATAAAGAVSLATVAVGPAASLAVEAAGSSLLVLNEAPDGAVAAFADAAGRLRVLYEERRDPAADQPLGAATTAAVQALRPTDRTRRGLRLKSWAYGAWCEEAPLPDWTGEAAAPAAAPLADGRMLAAWIDAAQPEGARLRLAVGAARPPRPATIVGRRAGPFALVVGTRVAFRGAFGTQVLIVNAADYANPAAATVAEVAAAIAAQCPALTAAPAAGALRVSTLAAGDGPRLAVDLAASTAARALGLAEPRLAGRGDWDPAVDWTGPLAGPRAAGPVADPSLAADPDGGARLFWAEHGGGLWRIRQAHVSERLTVVTAQGVSQRTGGGPWTSWHVADGLPSDDVRAVAADARGALWLATAAGLAERTAGGSWATFTTADGLGSDDLRDAALLADGRLWLATPAGVSVRAVGGAITVIAAAPGGLVDADVRAVAADEAGAAWAATPAGVSRRGADGSWRSWSAADGLPAGAPRRVAAGPGGQVALATATGVAIFDGGQWRAHGVADGLPSADARAVAWGSDGTLYAATAAGLGLWDGRRWHRRTPADGLPATDLRAVAALPDGRIALGTAAGLLVGEPAAAASGWNAATVADGLAGPVVVGVHGGWSTAVTLADGAGGNREPRAATDAGGRTWLFWSRRSDAAATARDSWTLRLRRYDPATAAWGGEQAITAPPAGGAADREPAPEPAGAGFRVFFASDRGGGKGLRTVAVDGGGVAGSPVALPGEAAEVSRPAPLPGPGGRTWLVCRSDAPVALAQVAVVPPPGAAARASARVPEAAALSVRAGARTPVMAHAARNLGRRHWGDFFVYTPEHPNLTDAETPSQGHVYTRRSVGLYLRQSPIGVTITAEAVGRLRQMLGRFLPVNLRLVMIVAPEPFVEFVYTPGADIDEAWFDDMPFVDNLDGLADATAATMPDVFVAHANELASLSFSEARRATLRRRTWFPDLV